MSLSRKCEERQDKRPIPSDIPDSGNIESGHDTICMIYRDEVYKPDTDDKGNCRVYHTQSPQRCDRNRESAMVRRTRRASMMNDNARLARAGVLNYPRITEEHMRELAPYAGQGGESWEGDCWMAHRLRCRD